jgi:hypothetical protein
VRRAHEIDSSDPATADLLVAYLLEALEKDYEGFADDLPLLERLVNTAQQGWRLAQIQAEGLMRQGNVAGAARIYLRLAAEDEHLPQRIALTPRWSAPRHRWIRGQLGDLRRAASLDDQRKIDSLVAPYEAELGDNPSIGQLQRHLDYFADLGRGPQLQHLLARKLLDLGGSLRSELLLLELTTSDDERTAAAAHAALAELLHDEGRSHAARQHDQKLKTAYATVVCLRGLTGREVAARHATRDRPAPAKRWAYGAVPHRIRPLLRTRSGRNPPDRYQGIRFEGAADPVLDGYRCFIDQQRRQLAQGTVILQDPLGRDEITVPLLLNESGIGAPNLRGRRCHAVARGGLVVVSLGDYVVAIDGLSRATDGNRRLLWAASLSDGIGDSPLAAIRTNNRPASQVAQIGQSGRWFAVDEQGMPEGVLGPVTPHGVAYQAGGRLVSVDPVGGRINWVREDLPSGCLLFGDDERLFAIPPGGATAIVLRTLDGKRLGTRAIPPIDEHLGTSGRSILCWRKGVADRSAGEGVVRELVRYDADAGRPVWTRKFPPAAKCALVESAAVGVVDPSGRFQLVDVEGGHDLVDQPIRKEPRLADFHVLLARDAVFLITNEAPGAARAGLLVYPVLDTDFPIVTGHIYRFDRHSGEPCWPVPAKVRRQGLALWQPRDLPVLAFASQANRDERGSVELLCLDRADGRAVFHATDLKRTYGRCRLLADEGDSLSILLTSQIVTLRMTSQPISPAPPFDQDLEVARPTVRRGLFKILQGL